MSSLILKISPFLIRGSAICWPMLGLARPAMAVMEEIAEMISGAATTIPVRVPGRPSFERLRVRITCLSQCGVISLKMILGNGAP